MIGTMSCQYETPCGWCVKFDCECKERCRNKLKKKVDAEKETLSQAAKQAGWKSGVMNC